MVSKTQSNFPQLTSRTSVETLLCHSQSPTFADTKSPELNEESKSDEKTENNVGDGLKFRDVQKRHIPVSPTKQSEPEVKKAKESSEECPEPARPARSLADFCSDVRESQKRMEKILCSNIDIHEMYRALLKSASAIPCPRTLVLTNEELLLESSVTKCSVEDRKSAILNLFSRRFALKVCSETLHLSVGLLDQCLDVMIVQKEALVDLAAVTMVIASKVEEINCLTVYTAISHNLVEGKTVKMISLLERVVLNALSFEVTVPTPLTYATYLLVHLAANPTIIYSTHYLLELSTLYVHNRIYPSDVVAHAATCLSFALHCDRNKSCLKALLDVEVRLHTFSGIDVASERTREVMRTLVDLFAVAIAEDHSIYREYSTFRRHSVAQHRIDVALLKALKIESA
ncbi:unnamed protein product [Caenorhabditis sp. 36 PRJEB53466]|nr:unnamed protein product [Caenorhabditis sp. 36 PRJEB53466]